ALPFQTDGRQIVEKRVGEAGGQSILGHAGGARDIALASGFLDGAQTRTVSVGIMILSVADAHAFSLPLYSAACALGSTYSLNISRKASLLILPVAPSGIFSTKTTSSGVHHLAILPSMCASTVSLVGLAPGRGSTISSGRSSHFGWRTP